MEITHETLEALLKIQMDKLKFHLILKYPNDAYQVRLDDELINDAVITKGDPVTVRIKTKRFSDAITKRKGNEFRQLLESTLRLIPKMLDIIGHTPIADVLQHNPNTDKFTPLTARKYESQYPKHPYEKEIHYSYDVRTTAIHWKSGVVIREFGQTLERSLNKARRKILTLLQDPEVYKRSEDTFLSVEPREDILYDLVLECKILNKEEIVFLIRRLEEEYLK